MKEEEAFCAFTCRAYRRLFGAHFSLLCLAALRLDFSVTPPCCPPSSMFPRVHQKKMNFLFFAISACMQISRGIDAVAVDLAVNLDLPMVRISIHMNLRVSVYIGISVYICVSIYLSMYLCMNESVYD